TQPSFNLIPNLICSAASRWIHWPQEIIRLRLGSSRVTSISDGFCRSLVETRQPILVRRALNFNRRSAPDGEAVRKSRARSLGVLDMRLEPSASYTITPQAASRCLIRRAFPKSGTEYGVGSTSRR